MHHEAHVGLVDAHAEGDGGHHHLQVIAQESLLHLAAPGGRQSRVVGRRGHTLFPQLARDLLHPLAAQRVDNARLTLPGLQKPHKLIERLVFLQHRVVDVGAVEAADVLPGLRQPEHAHDVGAGLRIGGRGQGDDRYLWKVAAQHAELRVLGAEVVPPLRHAVRLVDGDECDVNPGKPVQEAAVE